jgi:high-affinity Fe2+/Pb2+ permease
MAADIQAIIGTFIGTLIGCVILWLLIKFEIL